jgi:hypothetical protein
MARSILDRLLELIARLLARSADDGDSESLRKPAAALAEAAHVIAEHRTYPPAADGHDVAARYGECRDAYEELIALCALIHAERDGAFDAAHREQLARGVEAAGIGGTDAAKALQEGYVALLRDPHPWQAALARLLPRVQALHQFAERVDAAAERALKDSPLLQDASLQHVRAAGVKGAQAWLQEELVSGRRGKAPAFDTDIAAVDHVRRTATFLFGKARSAWQDHATHVRADFDRRVSHYRGLVSSVECARRTGRLEEALKELEQWCVSGAIGAPPRKRQKEGVTAQFLAKLEAANDASESLHRAERLVDTLEEWLTVVVTHLPVAVPAVIALLLVAFTANTVSRAMVPGGGVLNVGWDFFNLAHPERLVALLATLVVALLFFAAQLESVRRHARTLGWWSLGGFLLLAFAVPIGSAIAVKDWLDHQVAESPNWEKLQADLAGKGYDCRRGFRPDDRLGDFVVLSCDGTCDYGVGSGLFLPRERLAALEVLAGGVCFRLQDGKAAPPTPDPGLAAIAAAIRDAGPTQVRVESPAMDAAAVDKLALALRHVGDRLAGQKTLNVTMGKEIGAALDRYLAKADTGQLAGSLDAMGRSIGDSIGDAMRITSAELRLANCRQSHRLKMPWIGRRREDWKGMGGVDPCYDEYTAWQAKRPPKECGPSCPVAAPSQEVVRDHRGSSDESAARGAASASQRQAELGNAHGAH